jgi:glycopeptide antibiotics resistance protein
LLIVVGICGLGSRRFASGLPAFVAAYTGDTAWSLAAFLALGILFPWLETWRVAVLALLISFGVEVSQFYHAHWIDAIRSTTLGALALGWGFDPRDLACYTVGVGIGVVIETLTTKRLVLERPAQ